MKSVGYSFTLVGMMVAHCAVAYPYPAIESPVLESTGLVVGTNPLSNSIGYSTGSGDPKALPSTMSSGSNGEHDDGSSVSHTRKPTHPGRAQLTKPSNLFPNALPNELIWLVGKQLNPLDLAQVAQASTTTQKIPLSNKDYLKAVHAKKYIHPQITELLSNESEERENESESEGHEEALIQNLLPVEFANAMFQGLYTKLAGYRITPDGRPLPLDDPSKIDDQNAIRALPGLVPGLQTVYADWCYVRFDQLSRQQLSHLLPLVEFSLYNDAEQLCKVTEKLIGLETQKAGLLNLVVPSFSDSIPSNGELDTEFGSYMPSTGESRLYSTLIPVMTGALAAAKQFEKLGAYISCGLDFSDQYFGLENFLYLMVLEFNLNGLVREALAEFGRGSRRLYRCAQYLGFHRAYQMIIDEYGSPEPVTADFDYGFCTAQYGTYGMIHLRSPSPTGSNGSGGGVDTYPSISFRALRSALPQYPALPESAFEDQTVVEKLIK
ncbi:hypothetical protein H4R33_004399 [Dimargaris cristalligena]|uniref:F-box domain-containing protein n=1 Tax=Dimargaris cristalligena TaxID=215637 RepID=A0A4P9ZXA4_9FUNG|nr:hypothetical protein H4R33_004399 [Dimargaris cristalligena]RKP37651.1 hypothetical protein BJ085DRAFT_39302 [Dimargaris cristalligena]|eukprot:RKP37651.1 hypothetical protein BJ085DRAFT_39302 [Dimargaris cristalligena]